MLVMSQTKMGRFLGATSLRSVRVFIRRFLNMFDLFEVGRKLSKHALNMFDLFGGRQRRLQLTLFYLQCTDILDVYIPLS